MTVVAIANRLPVRRGDDGWELSPGGLVTALRPVMATYSGAWVGWDGGTRGIPAELPDFSVRLVPVSLTSAQVRQYYHGFANATLWPLLHDAIERPRFERAWWRSYQDVNAIFATAAEAALDERPGALAWVHDYHLTLVPKLIRERRPNQPIGFFLHTPWPPPDIFARLPWRAEVLNGLLGADVVSFHTELYRRNFLRACGRVLAGTGVQIHGPTITLPDRRVVRTTSAPISIDAAELAAEDRVLDALVGANASADTRQKFRKMLREGSLDDREVEIAVQENAAASLPTFEIPGLPGAQMGMLNLGDIFGKAFGARSKTKRMTVADSHRVLVAEESDKLLDQEMVVREATIAVEQNGIVFIDEIDKICGRGERIGGPDVSREGVQRDLLPLIEGTTVATKHGAVKTDHI